MNFFNWRSRSKSPPQSKKQPPPPEEEEEEPEVDDTLQLPSPSQVEAILNELADFNAQNLPPTYTYPPNPSALTYAGPDQVDQNLAENVQKIFNPTDGSQKWDREKLKTILMSIVQKEDSLMHPQIKKSLKSKQANKKESKDVLSYFYPNLIRLIIAVSTHSQNLVIQFTMRGKLPSMTENNRMHIWKDVLAKLNEIRQVILYENQQNQFLQSFPEDWAQIMSERNAKLRDLTAAIQSLEAEITSLQQNINVKNQEISQIQNKYQPFEDMLETKESEKMSMQQKLSQLRDVSNIVKNNMTQLDANNSTASTASHFFLGPTQYYYDA